MFLINSQTNSLSMHGKTHTFELTFISILGVIDRIPMFPPYPTHTTFSFIGIITDTGRVVGALPGEVIMSHVTDSIRCIAWGGYYKSRDR